MVEVFRLTGNEVRKTSEPLGGVPSGSLGGLEAMPKFGTATDIGGLSRCRYRGSGGEPFDTLIRSTPRAKWNFPQPETAIRALSPKNNTPRLSSRGAHIRGCNFYFVNL